MIRSFFIKIRNYLNRGQFYPDFFSGSFTALILSSYLVFFRILVSLIGEWAFSVFSFLPETGKSNPLSKFLRPMFEHNRLRGVLGMQLAGMILVVGVFGSSASASDYSNSDMFGVSYPEIAFVETSRDVSFSTEKRFQMPLETTGVSQGFQRYHPGVDMRAPLGTEIRSVANGVVEQVVRGQWGYGNALLVEHADNYSSMYAHVGRIFVEAGSDVDQQTVIAEVGTTGYTTGPHLHLEMYKDKEVVNLRPFLGY